MSVAVKKSPLARVKEEFGGKYEEFPVHTVEFSKRSRIGIGHSRAVQPLAQPAGLSGGDEHVESLFARVGRPQQDRGLPFELEPDVQVRRGKKVPRLLRPLDYAQRARVEVVPEARVQPFRQILEAIEIKMI